MSTAVPMIAVRSDQGPPLSIPLTFFLTGPVAIAIAGGVVMARADDGINTLWAPSNVAVMHLGVIGLVLFTMLGALYQMLPVVAGAVVPVPRLAHLVHALLVAGVASLVIGQGLGHATAFLAAIALMTAGLLLFLGPAGYALLKSGVTGPTAAGMKLALLALVAVGFAGLRMAATRAGAGFEGEWLTLRWAHAHLGFLCWVGGLITAVSWQVLPMFFLVASPPRAVAWTVFGGVAASLLGLSLPFVFQLPVGAVKWLALPGALAVWLVQPGWALSALAHRRRKRKDATTWYWWLAMGSGPVCLAAGAASVWLESPRWPVLYGVLVLWAWAGALVHGMLTRIVPFLVWLHRCSPLVGKVKMPSAKDLLPDRQVAIGFGLHAVSIACGLAAIASEAMIAWRIFGATLVLTAGALGLEILFTLRRARPVVSPVSPSRS